MSYLAMREAYGQDGLPTHEQQLELVIELEKYLKAVKRDLKKYIAHKNKDAKELAPEV